MVTIVVGIGHQVNVTGVCKLASLFLVMCQLQVQEVVLYVLLEITLHQFKNHKYYIYDKFFHISRHYHCPLKSNIFHLAVLLYLHV